MILQTLRDLDQIDAEITVFESSVRMFVLENFKKNEGPSKEPSGNRSASAPD